MFIQLFKSYRHRKKVANVDQAGIKLLNILCNLRTFDRICSKNIICRRILDLYLKTDSISFYKFHWYLLQIN